MRRPGFLIAIVGLALGGCYLPAPPGPVWPPPPQELPDLGGRQVTIGLPPDNLPYSFIDATSGAIEGFDYDLITLMAARLDFQPQFVAADPTTLLDDLAAGRFDLAGGGIAYTLVRAGRFDFASPYGLVRLHLVVRAGEDRVTTLAAFQEATALRIGTMFGTAAYDASVNFVGGQRVAGFSNYHDAVRALLAGTIDAVTLEDPVLQREQAACAGCVVALPGPLAGVVLAYALPLGSDLTGAINLAALQLQSDGAIAALLDEWGGLPQATPPQ